MAKLLLFIETPGKDGKFKAMIIGIIKFSHCFQYESKKQFYQDQSKHMVNKNSPYAWKDKPKWGWVVSSFHPFNKPMNWFVETPETPGKRWKI